VRTFGVRCRTQRNSVTGLVLHCKENPLKPVSGCGVMWTYPGYQHVIFDVLIERMEPETLLSWRWHPAAVDPAVDYSHEADDISGIRTARDAERHASEHQ